VRLFVALWPPPAVVAVLAGLDRPADPGVRWTSQANWHATLRFLGEVEESRLPDQIDALHAVGAGHPPRTVSLGPATALLGPGNLIAPVTDVDDLAAAARAAFGSGDDQGERFVGHLTIARARGRRRLPRALAGQPIEASWTATEVTLVSSRPGRAADGGSAYEVLATARLSAAPPEPPARG